MNLFAVKNMTWYLSLPDFLKIKQQPLLETALGDPYLFVSSENSVLFLRIPFYP